MPYDVQIHKPRRIALFSGNYNYVMDGPVRALNQLVGYLEQQGVEVLVFAPTSEKPAFNHQGTLISVPSVPIPGRSEYRVALGLPRSIKQQLAAFNPDLIHLAAPDFLGHGALKWAEDHNIPAVASFHTRFDTYPRYYHMAWLEKYITAFMRRFYQRCEQVYVPSPCMAAELRTQNMAHTLGIWSRGVDASLFSPSKRDMDWRQSQGITNDEVVIAFVGRLVLEKGLGVFADTLDQLKARGHQFKALIVGEGPERERFTHRLPDAVFTGYQSGEALARAYASADIFFNASVTETFGNVTLEAMACGLPLVEDGKNGFLSPSMHPEAFADCLEKIIENKTLRASMADASFTHSHAYTWDAVLGRLFDQYCETLDAYGGRTEHQKKCHKQRSSVFPAE
jgi:glycosyltransferase involved in cell wall biosynthesis